MGAQAKQNEAERVLKEKAIMLVKDNEIRILFPTNRKAEAGIKERYPSVFISHMTLSSVEMTTLSFTQNNEMVSLTNMVPQGNRNELAPGENITTTAMDKMRIMVEREKDSTPAKSGYPR